MRITKDKLKQLIKEELAKLDERDPFAGPTAAPGEKRDPFAGPTAAPERPDFSGPTAAPGDVSPEQVQMLKGHSDILKKIVALIQQAQS